MAIENFEEKVNILEKESKEALQEASDLARLENIRIKYLGRKGVLNELVKELPDIREGSRARFGHSINFAKDNLERLIDEKSQELKNEFIAEKLEKEKIDITMPGKIFALGHLHPLTKVERRIEDIFQSMGFEIVFGSEIESEYYNFDALNIPKNHPARDLQDTFWLRRGLLLRTHTSPMQARYMEKNNPPLRIIVPGRVFRHEATDASHEIQFHQVEGLMVGEDVSLANLKAVFEEFFKKFFSTRGKKIEVRFRPGYFPFVEPGMEIDIKIASSKWLEVVGAGMVHRKVFKSAGYAPGKQQGFAFGLGLERLAMLYYGINDIRLFYSSDFRFLKQF